jgi:NDP-sugar pyrophosphorylase family protein
MKYAIIAAGEGSRLAEEGIAVPKPLVKVAGQCLVDRLIRVFLANDAEEIVVVCNDLTPFVDEHLRMIERDGFEGRMIPLRHIVRTTPSSMHSFYELSEFLKDSPFVLTTVDTIFRDEEFADYIAAFKASLADGSADGMMGVTDYVDDEKPLYVASPPALSRREGAGTRMEFPLIENFLDADPDGVCPYISGGIYGLTPKAIDTLNRCMAEGKSRMRNFQRGLIEDGLRLLAFPFSKVLDIDHAKDVEKAEEFLRTRPLTRPSGTLSPRGEGKVSTSNQEK